MTVQPRRSSRLKTALCGAVRRFPAARGRWRALRAIGRLPGPPYAAVRAFGTDFAFDLREDYERWMALGQYEPELAGLLRRALRPGDACVDVGAQLGYTAAQAVEAVGPEGRAVLFEPDPRPFAELRRSFGGRSGCELVQAACSDHPGTVTFNLAGTVGHSRVVEDGRDWNVRQLSEVPTVVLDDWLEARAVGRIRLLKMDIEGHELAALRGLRRTLEAGAIDVLVMESNAHLQRQNGYEPGHLHAMMTRAGYAGAFLERRAWITRDAMEAGELEDLLYVLDAGVMEALLPGIGPRPGDGFGPGELERLAREALDPAEGTIEARRLVQLAARMHLDEAIARGRELLARRPDMHWFRGHVAHWLAAAGRRDEARAQYEILCEAQPDDGEARRLRDSL